MPQPYALDRRHVLIGGVALLTCGHPAGASVPAYRARDFVDSIGVNVHLDSDFYASRYARISSLLGSSGIRHLRDELRPGNNLKRWRDLSTSHGIQWNLLVSSATNTIEDMLRYIDALDVDHISAVEGQNEGDSDWFMSLPQGANWSASVVAYQRDVYQALRARFSTATLPLLSPSIIDWKPADVALIKAAAQFSDIVAIHAYVQHGQEPETQDEYAGLQWYFTHMRDAFKPGAPVMVTEAGYCNLPDHSGTNVSETASAIYLPRLLLNNFAAGVRRTFLYEFMDGGTSPDDGEQHWGLVRADGVPKPAFHALRRLILAMQEPHGSGLPLNAVDVETVGGPQDLRRMIFQKSDGSLVVAIWRAIRSWDARTSSDLSVAPMSLSLMVGRNVQSAHWMKLNSDDDWVETPIRSGKVDVPLSDRVLLIRLTG